MDCNRERRFDRNKGKENGQREQQHRCDGYSATDTLYPKSRHERSVPVPKVKIFALVLARAGANDFPLFIWLVSNEDEQLSSEVLQAARVSA
jgi:hypothetical protein